MPCSGSSTTFGSKFKFSAVESNNHPSVDTVGAVKFLEAEQILDVSEKKEKTDLRRLPSSLFLSPQDLGI
jgi:hypothetical protein